MLYPAELRAHIGWRSVYTAFLSTRKSACSHTSTHCFRRGQPEPAADKTEEAWGEYGMASKNDARHWLEVLGLAPGATQEQFEVAYRDLVKVWHPDRFVSDPSLRTKAQEKLRELNVAYEGLRRSGIPPRDPAPTTPPQTGPALWNKTAAARSSRWGTPWRLVTVVMATAVIVAIVLAIMMRRDAVVPTDIALTPAPPRRTPQPRFAQKSEPAPAPAAPTHGALIVLSEPSGGTIYVNDELVGHAPMTLPSLLPGAYRIRVQLGNYPAWSSTVQIEAGASEKLVAFIDKGRLP